MLPHLLALLISVILNPCPTFEAGDMAILKSHDALNGQRVAVVQPGVLMGTGRDVYVVRLVDVGGYVGASGCELEVLDAE